MTTFKLHPGLCCGMKVTRLDRRHNVAKLPKFLSELKDGSKTKIRLQDHDNYHATSVLGNQLLKFSTKYLNIAGPLRDAVKSLGLPYAVVHDQDWHVYVSLKPTPNPRLVRQEPMELLSIGSTRPPLVVSGGCCHNFCDLVNRPIAQSDYRNLANKLQVCHEAILTKPQLGSYGVSVFQSLGWVPAINWSNNNTGSNLVLFTAADKLVETTGVYKDD